LRSTVQRTQGIKKHEKGQGIGKIGKDGTPIACAVSVGGVLQGKMRKKRC